MDVEKALLSKAVRSGQTEKLISLGIEEQHFEDPATRAVFTACVEHLRRFRTPPSLEAVSQRCPDFSFDVSTDALEYLAEQFVKQVKRRAAIRSIRYLAPLVDDPAQLLDIDAIFLEQARELSRVVPSTRIARFSEMDLRIAAYHQMLEADEKPGIPMGIPTFDRLTHGIQKHEFAVIAGYQGTGKSSLLLHIFFNAYVAGKTPLLVSLEMEADAIHRRLDVMATNFEYAAMKALELGEGDMRKWEQWAERARNAPNDIIILDAIGRCTVDKVYAETVRYSPDMVGLDYISLMDAPRFNSTWEKVTYLTRELKMNARTLKIPLFAIAQTNRESAEVGARLDNLSHSYSVGMDSDIVMGLWRDEAMEANEKMEVRLLKNRDGKIGKTFMKWQPERMHFRQWEDSDTWQREQSDGSLAR